MPEKKTETIARQYDVLIVGAGPAGAAAARFLVKNGLRVLILERRKLPRYKICSGLVMERAQNLIEESFGRTRPASPSTRAAARPWRISGGK